MRLKKVKGALDRIKKSKYYIECPENNKGIWKKVFNNGNPIHIEIGMGKGKFIINMAIIKKNYFHLLLMVLMVKKKWMN